MVARKQCNHVFGDAHQQMHLHFIVGKPLARALPRSSTEGVKVAWLAGLLTQPPAEHSHICSRLFGLQKLPSNCVDHCHPGMQMWAVDILAQTDSMDRQHGQTAWTDSTDRLRSLAERRWDRVHTYVHARPSSEAVQGVTHKQPDGFHCL